MKFLPTQHLRDYDFADMERQLKDVFYAILFGPTLAVIDEFNPSARGRVVQIRNAVSEEPLREALNTGRVQYQNGNFSGEFSAAISGALRDMGAKFDKHERVYKLGAAQVPGWVKAEASNYQSKARIAHNLIKQKLDEIQIHLDEALEDHPVDANNTIGRVEKGFQEIGQRLSINEPLSEDRKGRLAAEYTENMKLWIKNFSQKEITSLRQIVGQNAQQGYRFDKLTRGIQGRYDVSVNKAKFLARQETSLFMAKYREERFKESGVRRYKWRTSHDGRVRHDHVSLDGRIFTYDSPPVVDKDNGRRGNPGQDYNCRCVDMPILEAVAVA